MKKLTTFGNLAVFFLLAIVFLSTGFILWNTFKDTRAVAVRMRANANDLADTLASTLEVPMWDLDRRNIETICTFHLKNEHVVSVLLADISGEVFFDKVKAPAPQGEQMTLVRDIHGNGEHLGTLTLEMVVGPGRALTNSLWQSLVISLFIVLLAIVVLFMQRGRHKIAVELAQFNQHLENQVELRTRELRRSKEELMAVNEQLRRMDKLKSSFLSSVAHELRTPMTSIYGFSKLIGNDLKTLFPHMSLEDKALVKKWDRIQQNLGTIISEGERLTRLINDVLDISKIESEHMEWNDQTVHMGELLTHCAGLINGVFYQKQAVDFRTDLAQGLPVMTVDPDRLTQVFLNILHNAAKFTETGEVVLSARTMPDGALHVEVADTGPGIPEQYLDRVFDRFLRTGPDDTMNDAMHGAGLGLAICKQIVEHYQGAVWAGSNRGHGTLITVELPPDRDRTITTR